MKNKIVVVGSSNTDMIVKSDKFPEPGETLLGGNFYISPGGKGANQAVAAARLGGEVIFICKVGDDDFGKRSVEGYKKEGINTQYIMTDHSHPSGVALISVNSAGENKITVAPGANGDFMKEDIQTQKDLLSQAEIILLQLEIPLGTIGQVLKLAGENNIKVVLNPAPAQTLPDWYYKDLFLITPNETEAEQLTGISIEDENSALKASKRLVEMGVKNVVITMGKKGAFVFTNEYTGLVPAPKRDVVDTTGAGDVFNGALVVALAQKKEWEESVTFACMAASLSVSKIGAQSSSPFIKDLNVFTENF